MFHNVNTKKPAHLQRLGRRRSWNRGPCAYCSLTARRVTASRSPGASETSTHGALAACSRCAVGTLAATESHDSKPYRAGAKRNRACNVCFDLKTDCILKLR